MKYTPSGMAIFEFTVAIPQRFFEKDTVGYIEVMMIGESAVNTASSLKVGQQLSLKGRLFSRAYKNRRGTRVTETKVLAETIEGESK